MWRRKRKTRHAVEEFRYYFATSQRACDRSQNVYGHRNAERRCHSGELSVSLLNNVPIATMNPIGAEMHQGRPGQPSR